MKHLSILSLSISMLAAASAVTATAATIPATAREATIAEMRDMSYVGWRASAHYDAALKFHDPALKGCKIVGAKVLGLLEQGMGNYTLWTTPTLPDGEITGNVVSVTQEGTEVKGAFPNPVTIGDDPIYVGISMDVITADDNTGWPVPYSAPDTYKSDVLRFRCTEDYTWDDLSSYGTLPIVLYIDGNLPDNALQPNRCLAVASALPNTNFSLPIEVVNYSGSEVKSMELSYTCAGKNHSFTANLETPISAYMTLPQQVTVPMEGVATPGAYDITLSVDKVNGKANNWTNKTLKFSLSIAAFKPVNRPLLEEGTGTTCGYCPRGTLALKEMSKRYPDFIAAAYHKYKKEDPMFITFKLPWSDDGFPCANLNRLGNRDPFFGNAGGSLGIAKDYEAAREVVAPADVKVSATYNADSTVITVNSSARFALAEPGQTYKLGYILTIDGVNHDTLPAWKQTNYYDGGNDSDPLLKLLNDPSTFDAYTFNHVVFHSATNSGITLKAEDIVINKDYTNTKSFNIASNQIYDKEAWNILDEDPANINVIAVLIDSNNRIRNAAQYRFAPTATGINTICRDELNGETIFYDLTGRRVLNPDNGIFIRLHNGQADKIAL